MAKKFAPSFIILALVLVLFGAADAQAKKHKNVSYFGEIDISGQWDMHWDCIQESYHSGWHMQGLLGKARIEPAGEMNLTIGGASGSLSWTRDDLCNGSLQSGTCPVVLADYVPPFYLWKAKGGVRVIFDPPVGLGPCPNAHDVGAYGMGFEAMDRMTQEPTGLIPARKLGKKKRIVVPLSGSDRGTASGRSFSGSFAGTLTLTKKKPLLQLAE